MLAAVIAMMMFSVAAHLAALRRDLPIADVDEGFFVPPAVAMAATGDLNPHWFGHPGSTVIYPIAALVHAYDVVAHHGPILGSDRTLVARFRKDPSNFYLIGRLWTIALGVATIPLLYLLGRRSFGRRTALIGAALWTVLPYPIQAARTVRTDSAAIFFGILALYCCVRIWQTPGRRWWLLAGAATGLAVSTRWFMVALLPCLAATAVISSWPHRRRAIRATAYALVASATAFVVTTPYSLLDFATLRRDLGAEANAPHAFAGGLSPPGNARWYVGTALPQTITWAIFVLAVVGVVLIAYRRIPYQLVLVAFALIFLAGISLSKWHWQRWSIEIVPLLTLFAALTVNEATRWIATRFRARSVVAAIAAAIVIVALAVGPLSDLRDANRRDAAPTTRKLARDWMRTHIPSGSWIMQLPQLFGTRPQDVPELGGGIRMTPYLDPVAHPLATYRTYGVDYVAVFAGDPYNAMMQRASQPARARFFVDLACHTRLVARMGHDTFGDPGISIYRIDRPPVKLLNLLCLQRPSGA